MGRPRVVVISHTYVVGANRPKWNALARLVDLTLIVPLHWRDALRVMPLEPLSEDVPYGLRSLPTVFNGRLARYFYSPVPLWNAIRAIRPALVHIEEEPIGLSMLQVALLKPVFHFRLSFFTWQNIALPTTPIEAFNFRRADAAIAGNKAAVRVLQSKGYCKPIACVPQLGVDVPSELTAQTRLSPFRIGYVGRLVGEKGLLILFDALAGLAGDWELQLVGDGPLRATLERLSASNGLEVRVQFTGTLPHSTVPEYLRDMDALVLPSLTTPTWKEQFGHVLIEAMAAGVPVVGSDSGAIPEVIGDAGLIVPENQPEALRAALQRLMSDARLRGELTRKGLERVRAEFTHEQIARKTWDLWQQAFRT
jgi:glycosyltransferase involved in cell wall biosynthesis